MKFVIVYPYKFTDNYLQRYEIEFLHGFGEVVVWEMGNFLHPRFTKGIAAPSSEQNFVRKVTSRIDFARELKELGFRRGKGGKVVFLQFSPSTSFRALVCNILIKLRADTIVDFSNSGVPFENDGQLNAPRRKFGSRVIAEVAKLIQIFRDREFSRGYQTAWSTWVPFPVIPSPANA